MRSPAKGAKRRPAKRGAERNNTSAGRGKGPRRRRSANPGGPRHYHRGPGEQSEGPRDRRDPPGRGEIGTCAAGSARRASRWPPDWSESGGRGVLRLALGVLSLCGRGADEPGPVGAAARYQPTDLTPAAPALYIVGGRALPVCISGRYRSLALGLAPPGLSLPLPRGRRRVGATRPSACTSCSSSARLAWAPLSCSRVAA